MTFKGLCDKVFMDDKKINWNCALRRKADSLAGRNSVLRLKIKAVIAVVL